MTLPQPSRWFTEWDSYLDLTESPYTSPQTVGPAPHVKILDEDGEYVRSHRQTDDGTSGSWAVKLPDGFNLYSVYHDMRSWTPPAWTTSGTTSIERYRIEMVVQCRLYDQGSVSRDPWDELGVFNGSPGGGTLFAWLRNDGGDWNLVGSPWDGAYVDAEQKVWTEADDGVWQSVFTGAGIGKSTLDLLAGLAATGDLALRCDPNLNLLPGMTLDQSFVALWLGPGGAPPLRQNQRDDIRQGQRTSRQLTVRQVGYL